MKNSVNYHSNKLLDSELILNSDGSVYHLHLLPEHIADMVLLVGDQDRVQQISKRFEKIEVKIQNREFVTHTGYFNAKRITVLSTGIGTDNIDIALNELDAAVNIDLQKKTMLPNPRKLTLVRIGTSGALQSDIPVDSFALSTYGLGFDGLLHYYKPSFESKEVALSKAFKAYYPFAEGQTHPYAVRASERLINLFGEGMVKGITATASGFYAPQGRSLRLQPKVENQNELLHDFKFEDNRIINFEMETAALYGLGAMLGHDCCTVCAVIANRFTQQYSSDYHVTIDRLIDLVLRRLTI